jgi:hypothetical protein
MTTASGNPRIACTLAPGEFKDRLAWIAELTRNALRGYERHDLILVLKYVPEAAERVNEMVRREKNCCSFLTFDVRQHSDEIRLTIKAPEEARIAADMLFEQFVASAEGQPACGCEKAPQPFHAAPGTASRDPGAHSTMKAAGVAAVTLASGAVACGACCVLPFAVPAVALAGAGSMLALLAGAHAWVTGVAAVAVAGAWIWI